MEIQKATKHDEGKVQYSDLPVNTLESVAKVFNFGAKKYSKFNYLKGMEWLRYYDACMRHLSKWLKRHDFDDETKLNHIDHAIACLMMLRENIHLNVGIDDRAVIKENKKGIF